MARSGGTLISKCLACMDGVVLLSEIHPLGTRQFNPIAQARQWFDLLSSDDLARLVRAGSVEFAAAIHLIEQRARERGRRLVLRDWSHLDFTGVPFVAPAYRLRTAEALRTHFTLIQVCTVRHPLDQWLSLSRLAVVQGRLGLPQFLHGYRRFAEVAAGIGFHRYEDFVAAPAAVLEAMCRRLELAFDPGFATRWPDWDKITGDVGERQGRHEIRPAPRRPLPPGLLTACAANPDYRAALDLLGYRHPG